MATVFNYFYIGEQTLYSNELNLQPPTLLTFSKIQNGAKGETLPHLHTYLELFYFEKGDGFLETNNKTIPLKANDLLVIDSKKIHVQYSESNEEPLSYFDFAIDNLHLRGMPANSISQRGIFCTRSDHGGTESIRTSSNCCANSKSAAAITITRCMLYLPKYSSTPCV